MTMTCGNCACWRDPDADSVGECWSMDRLDNDESKGPAGYSYSSQSCEAWEPVRTASPAPSILTEIDRLKAEGARHG